MFNYCSMIIHNAMFTNVDTMVETKMTSSLALWTFTKAHCCTIYCIGIYYIGVNLKINWLLDKR